MEEGGELVQVRGGDPLVEVHRLRGSPMDGGGFARQGRRISFLVFLVCVPFASWFDGLVSIGGWSPEVRGGGGAAERPGGDAEEKHQQREEALAAGELPVRGRPQGKEQRPHQLGENVGPRPSWA